jgi:hypothetical protein
MELDNYVNAQCLYYAEKLGVFGLWISVIRWRRVIFTFWRENHGHQSKSVIGTFFLSSHTFRYGALQTSNTFLFFVDRLILYSTPLFSRKPTSPGFYDIYISR